MNPLVEVVGDTVGRHDTFQLACYAKYYEDMGHRHVNCTDNFNGALDPHGVAKREGWPALNFFFNTAYADRFLATDEPCRARDYVLLRALDDLVCASSACPDDIDPAKRVADHRRARARVPGGAHVLDGDGAADPRCSRRC